MLSALKKKMARLDLCTDIFYPDECSVLFFPNILFHCYCMGGPSLVLFPQVGPRQKEEGGNHLQQGVTPTALLTLKSTLTAAVMG